MVLNTTTNFDISKWSPQTTNQLAYRSVSTLRNTETSFFSRNVDLPDGTVTIVRCACCWYRQLVQLRLESPLLEVQVDAALAGLGPDDETVHPRGKGFLQRQGPWTSMLIGTVD